MLMQGLDAKRLSRRALLKGLGMGVGLVTLGGLSGCTQIAQRSGSHVLLAPAGASNALKRLARLAYEAKEAWKEVLQGYYRWKTIRDESIKLALPEKIQKAKDYTLAVADGLDTEGLTPKLNGELAKVDFNKVNREEAIKRLMRELSDVKLLPDVSDQLEQVLR